MRRLLLARDGHAEVANALRVRVQADASIVAILVARVSPHGYFVEVEVEQRRSGELWWRSRSGEKDEFSSFEQHPRSGEFDLVAAFPRLRQEGLLLRAGLEERGAAASRGSPPTSAGHTGLPGARVEVEAEGRSPNDYPATDAVARRTIETPYGRRTYKLRSGPRRAQGN